MSTEDRSPGQEPDETRRSEPPEESELPREPRLEPEASPGDGPEDERLRILRLVAQGRVTAGEAAELLAALEPRPDAPAPHPAVPPTPPPPPGWPGGAGPLPPGPPFGPGPFGGSFGPGPFGPGGVHPEADVRWTIAARPPGPGRGAPGREATVTVRPGQRAVAYAAGGTPGRTLVIISRSSDGGQVEARVPLDLGEAGRMLIPKQVKEVLEHHEINLEEVLERPQILAATPSGETIVSLQDGEGGQLTISVE